VRPPSSPRWDALGGERRRDGAHAWGLFEDTTDPGRYLEYFLVGSWLEHQCQHERVTRSDADLQATSPPTGTGRSSGTSPPRPRLTAAERSKTDRSFSASNGDFLARLELKREGVALPPRFIVDEGRMQ